VDNILVEYGSELREKRTRLDLSQKDLADRLGLSQPYIQRIESGKVNITLVQAQRITEALRGKLTIKVR
jgi:predicted transcriptional regulator